MTNMPQDAERLLREARSTIKNLGGHIEHADHCAGCSLIADIDAHLSSIESKESAAEHRWSLMPKDLHPATKELVFSFAMALADKLYAAEQKYGYSDGWKTDDWMDECRRKLREHIGKGDPRDVAAYCAFLWYHKESTKLSAPPATPVQSQCEKCGTDLVPCCPICSTPKPLNWQAAEQGYKLVPVSPVQSLPEEPAVVELLAHNEPSNYVGTTKALIVVCRYAKALRSLLAQREGK